MRYTLKTIITLIILLTAISVWADYYDNVINLSGQPLYNGLRSLISTNTYSNYSGAKVYLFQTLDKTGSTVKCVYTGEVFSINSSYSGQTSPNTEHTFAQSWFNPDSNIKKSDLHHLFITQMEVNSSRGNYPFDYVVNHTTANVYYNNTPLQSYRGNNVLGITAFEPPHNFKGNVARALLYFNTRYGDSLTQGNINMISTLRDWHIADPPDAAEVQRNQLVQSFQGNRNPFVDHPEFVNRIWGPVANEDETHLESPSLRIDNIYPNPCRDKLTVLLDAKSTDSVQASIFNIKGKVVFTKTLVQIGRAHV